MSKKYSWIIILFLLFPLSLIIYNYICLSYNCINSYDVGIFGEGLIKMGYQGNLNPWLSVRNINLFNDHFPLIMILYGYILKIFPYTPYNFLFLEYFWFLVTLFLIYYLGDNDNKKLYLMISFIFCKGILIGMMFPVHPLTWSIPFFYLLVYSIYRENSISIIMYSFILCLFREEIPFSILGLSFFYLLKSKKMLFLQLFILSTIFLTTIFYLRPLLLGPTINYGGPIIKSILEAPIRFFLASMWKIDLKQLKMYVPFIIPLGLIISYNYKRQKFYNFFKSPLMGIVFLSIPLICLRILTNKFSFHYGPPLMVILIGVMSFDSFWDIVKDKKQVIGVTLFLFMITSSSNYTKMFKLFFLKDHPKCTISKEKKESSVKLLKLVDKTLVKNKIIGSTGGIIVHLLRPDRKILHLGQAAEKVDSFDFLLLEQNNSGDTWPLSTEQINKIKNQCLKNNNVKILYQDNYYLYLKGPIVPDCVEV